MLYAYDLKSELVEVREETLVALHREIEELIQQQNETNYLCFLNKHHTNDTFDFDPCLDPDLGLDLGLGLDLDFFHDYALELFHIDYLA